MSLIILCLIAAAFFAVLAYFGFCLSLGPLKNATSIGYYKSSYLNIVEREAMINRYAKIVFICSWCLAIFSVGFVIAALYFTLQLLFFSPVSVMA